MSARIKAQKIRIEKNQPECIVAQYEENEKAIDKARTKPLVLLIIMVATVVGMKSVQATASLTLNTVTTSFVLMLLCLHF